ncbi:MAG: hypothetical protein ACRDFQ_09780 [Anaerolineales bacterium]
MGHTLSTITQNYHRFLSYVKPFRRALRKSDQLVLDSLLDEAVQHLPAAGYAANLLPGVAFLLSLILEKHKQVRRVEADLENLRAEVARELQKSQEELKVEFQKLRTELFLLKNSSRNSNGH